MKKLILVVVMLLMSVATFGEVIRSGNNFTVQTEKSATKSKPIKSQFTYTDSKGNIYPIYIGANGGVYIIKISKKSGREYKQYLPKEIAEQIKKELNK